MTSLSPSPCPVTLLRRASAVRYPCPPDPPSSIPYRVTVGAFFQFKKKSSVHLDAPKCRQSSPPIAGPNGASTNDARAARLTCCRPAPSRFTRFGKRHFGRTAPSSFPDGLDSSARRHARAGSVWLRAYGRFVFTSCDPQTGLAIFADYLIPRLAHPRGVILLPCRMGYRASRRTRKQDRVENGYEGPAGVFRKQTGLSELAKYWRWSKVGPIWQFRELSLA